MLFLVAHSKIRCDWSNVWTKVGLGRYMVANHQRRFQSKFRISRNEIGRCPHKYPDEILVVELQVQLLTTFLALRTELNKRQQTNNCQGGLGLHHDDWCHRHKVLDFHINPEKVRGGQLILTRNWKKVSKEIMAKGNGKLTWGRFQVTIRGILPDFECPMEVSEGGKVGSVHGTPISWWCFRNFSYFCPLKRSIIVSLESFCSTGILAKEEM